MGFENKNIASAIANEFLSKKQKRDALIKERREELYKKIPALSAIEKEISSLSFSLFKKAADGFSPDKAAEEIREKSLSLTKKRDALIKEAGFGDDYLNPPYECPLCKDEGFIDNSYCHCFQKKLLERTLLESNLSSMQNNTFENFSLNWYSEEAENGALSPRDNMKKILSDCIKFSENFKTTDDNLLLTGPSGLGKTFLSSCIANHLIKKGIDVVYQSAGVIFSLLDKVKFGKNVSEEENYTLGKILNADLLILDDLGTEFITEFSVSELFRILNTRALNEKKTVISTNLSLADIKRIYSERIFSRIIGNFVILKFYGKDIRMLKKM